MNDDERRIDAVLVLMNDACEERGRDVSHIRFDFSNPQGDHEVQSLLASNQCTIEEFQRTIRQCKTRKFIEHACMGSKEFGNLALTRLGQARAISVKNGRNRSAELVSLTPPH